MQLRQSNWTCVEEHIMACNIYCKRGITYRNSQLTTKLREKSKPWQQPKPWQQIERWQTVWNRQSMTKIMPLATPVRNKYLTMREQLTETTPEEKAFLIEDSTVRSKKEFWKGCIKNRKVLCWPKATIEVIK